MRRISLLLLLLFLAPLGTHSAWAGPMEDANAAYARGDFATAHKMFESLAMKGDPEAQYSLAVMYINGEGVSRDSSIATKLFIQSANGGNPRAQYNIGVLYKDGIGVRKSTFEAEKWFLLAANHNIPEAQNNLAVLYFLGDGISRDYVKSYMWANIALANGYSAAQEIRRLSEGRMTREQIAQAQQLARDWKPEGLRVSSKPKQIDESTVPVKPDTVSAERQRMKVEKAKIEAEKKQLAAEAERTRLEEEKAQLEQQKAELAELRKKPKQASMRPKAAGPTDMRRTALVIGNSAYIKGPLKNPANDARDMAATLKALGFDVTVLTDATQQQMEHATREFGTKLRKGGVGLFYYAGHGVQVAGENYLIPVNAVIQSEGDVKYGSVNAGLILAKMEDAGNGLNIVILDACRSNPFARSFRTASEGLAKMDAPTGSLIAYSTAPGSVASDGSGRNGVFTKHLLNTMKVSGLPISEVLMRVRQGVVEETAKKQVPWEASSLIGQFYFVE